MHARAWKAEKTAVEAEGKTRKSTMKATARNRAAAAWYEGPQRARAAARRYRLPMKTRGVAVLPTRVAWKLEGTPMQSRGTKSTCSVGC